MITSSPTFGHDQPDGDEVAPDPIALMLMWLAPNESDLRPLMTLATIDSAGDPDARSVLVSRADRDGLHFHTDTTSRKVSQLEAHPRATALLAWPDVGRQLVVAGAVRRETPDEADAAFRARSAYLRVLATQNSLRTARLPIAQRRMRWAEAVRDGAADGPVPPTWVGFVLRPSRLTFWRGDPEGPSNRVEYRAGEEGWAITKLPG
jgi:pyridoxamine 5'-phosphate oxidase